jgi:hypothetical protein
MNNKKIQIMSPITVLLIFSALFVQCKSVKTNFDLPPTPDDFHDDQKCYHNGHLSKSQRRQIFPFNQAESVEIISFHAKLGRTPIQNDTIITSKTIEIKTLTEKQIDQLTDILYNYNYSKKTNLISFTETGCYAPRHAIVFCNKSKQVISYIEICLECRKTVSNLPKESLGNFCDGKYELLQQFFLKTGIKHFKTE